MHLGLHKCFIESLATIDQPSKDKCQAKDSEDGTKLLTEKSFNPVRNAGRLDGDTTTQEPQVWPLTYANNLTQTIESLQPGISTKTNCYWEIKNDYMKKYIRIQDMYVKFKEITGASIYITSYFREDRESNTIYPDKVKESMDKNTNITYEMYNTTFIYMVPGPNAPTNNRVLFDFWVYQTAEF